MADCYSPVVSVVKLAYEDTVEAWLGAKAIARSWAESPCTCAKFNEIPETDRLTDRQTHINPSRDAMQDYSCLALRRSATRDTNTQIMPRAELVVQ